MRDLDLYEPLERMFETLFEAIPTLLLILLILLVGGWIASALRSLTTRSLRKSGFNRLVHQNSYGNFMQRLIPRPSETMGAVVYWLIIATTVSAALSVIDVEIVNSLLESVYSYIPNIIGAILIFLVAGAISAAAVTFTSRVMGDTTTGKLINAVIPGVTMSIAVFMILDTLQIAPYIINTTYTAIVGTLAVATALAFGLGGRDVAGKILEDAYLKSGPKIQQAKQDIEVGKRNAKKEAKKVKAKVKN